MPRRGGAPKRDVLPDPRYNNVVLSKLINQVMVDGKKSVAQSVVYGAFDIIQEKTGSEPNEYFMQALENLKPVLETKARRVGGSNQQVPIEVSPERRQTLAIRWLVTYARKRNERTMKDKLAAEIMDAYNNAGGAYKKKDDVHRMAESNKAFAHYRWQN